MLTTIKEPSSLIEEAWSLLISSVLAYRAEPPLKFLVTSVPLSHYSLLRVSIYGLWEDPTEALPPQGSQKILTVNPLSADKQITSVKSQPNTAGEVLGLKDLQEGSAGRGSSITETLLVHAVS